MSHQLASHLVGQWPVETPVNVDSCKLPLFAHRVLLQFAPFPVQIGVLCVLLRVDGDELARGHRHGAGDQPRDTGQQNRPMLGTCSGHAKHQAGGRHDAVVGSQHGGPQPADAIAVVMLCVTTPLRDGPPRSGCGVVG